MIKVLFICHGNICRSPMAEYIMKNKIKGTAMEDQFYVESMATSTEELDNPVYPPARQILEANGIECRGHRARQVRKADYKRFDLIIAMDWKNITNLLRITGPDTEEKIHLLSEYTDYFEGDVADPWWCGHFDRTFAEVNAGVDGILHRYR